MAVDVAGETEEVEGEGTENGEEQEEGTRKRGSSQETYEAVKELLDQGVGRQDAFNQVAEQSGKSVSTVTTAYYRVNRKLDPDAPSRARGPRTAQSKGKKGATQVTLAAQLKQAIADMGKAMRSFERVAEQIGGLEADAASFRAAAKHFNR